MDNEKNVQLSDAQQFLKVVDTLEAAAGNGNDETAYYCRQYLATKYDLPLMPAPAAPPADTAANPSAPVDPTTQAADPNAQPAPDAGTQPQA